MKQYYDITTKNISFLEVSEKLKAVKNSKFMLSLFDPSLCGVDPYDNNLSLEMKDKIIHECKINPWYFLREVLRVPSQGGGTERFNINKGTLAQIYLFLKGIDSWLTIPRQNFATGSELAILTWVYLFGSTETNIAIVARNKNNGSERIKKIYKYIDNLPDYMKSTPNSFKNVIYNKSAFCISKEQAKTLSRSLTCPVIYFEEPDYIPYIKEIISESSYTYTYAKNIAKENGTLYGRLFGGIPGDLADESGKDALDIISNCIPWTEKMYDWTDDQLKAYFELKIFSNDIVYIEYEWYELGKDIEWIEDMSKCIPYEGIFRREILLQRFDSTLIDSESSNIDKLVESIKKFINKG